MKVASIFVVILGILGLIGVRTVEDRIFYDPFLNYFHEANENIKMPEFEWGRLVINYVLRFLLNLFFSAIILQFLFHNNKWTVQGIVLITMIFVITLPVYLYCISTNFEIGYQFSFYMRRFVIQPIVLLMVIAIFYYRKKTLGTAAENADE